MWSANLETSSRKVAVIFQDGAEYFPLSTTAMGYRGSCGYRRHVRWNSWV